MAFSTYTIDGFGGMDQSRDQNSLSRSMSPDCINMDTSLGQLKVAKGCEKFIAAPIPGESPPDKLIMYRSGGGINTVAVCGNEVYAYKAPDWELIHTYEDIKKHKFQAITGDIGDKEYLIIASGESRLIKYDGESVSMFGSEEGLSDVPVNYLAKYRGRLFSAGDPNFPSRLYWSMLPGGARSIECWAPDEDSPNVEGGHTQVGDMGDPILALCALSNQLLIFKQASLFRLVGDKPSNFTLERIEASTESFAHSSLAQFKDAAYYFTNRGLYVFNGVLASRMPDADCIRELLEGCDTGDSRTALAGGKLMISLKKNGADMAVEYDLLRGVYMPRAGFPIRDLCACGDRIYMVNDRRLVYVMDEGNDYDGEPVNAHWQTPLSDLSCKSVIKTLVELYLRGSGENGAKLILDAAADGNTSNYRVQLPESSHKVLEIPLKNRGRTISLRLSNEAGGRFTVIGGLELLMHLEGRAR